MLNIALLTFFIANVPCLFSFSLFVCFAKGHLKLRVSVSLLRICERERDRARERERGFFVFKRAITFFPGWDVSINNYHNFLLKM